mgnify:CR=1 FL=1
MADSPEDIRRQRWEAIKCYSAIQNNHIPKDLAGCIQRYYILGIVPGSFAYALLCNNLIATVNAADGINLSELYHTVKWLGERFPWEAWGSKEKVDQHIQNCWREREAERSLLARKP